MWVSQVFFSFVTNELRQKLNTAFAEVALRNKLQGEVEILRAQVRHDHALVGWLQHRVNQLEIERQVLLQEHGIKIPVPKLSQPEPLPAAGKLGNRGKSAEDFQELLDSFGAFEDMGDEEAKRQHITHDTDGTVLYDKAVE